MSLILETKDSFSIGSLEKFEKAIVEIWILDYRLTNSLILSLLQLLEEENYPDGKNREL